MEKHQLHALHKRRPFMALYSDRVTVGLKSGGPQDRPASQGHCHVAQNSAAPSNTTIAAAG